MSDVASAILSQAGCEISEVMSIELYRAIIWQALYERVCEKAGFRLERGEFVRAVIDNGREMGIMVQDK